MGFLLRQIYWVVVCKPLLQSPYNLSRRMLLQLSCLNNWRSADRHNILIAYTVTNKSDPYQILCSIYFGKGKKKCFHSSFQVIHVS